jgi:CheY-like chemotaxis protein
MNPLSPLAGTVAETVRVLHVDDQPEFTDLTETFLEREDERFAVETATSANAGLEQLEATDVDCVISDYDMPEMNGIEFLEAVREQYPDLPFLLFTGKGSEEVASDAISAGVTDYLQKEGGSDQYTVLANRISNAIDHNRSRQMIERSEHRLREIIDAFPNPLYVVSGEGRYLLANEALASFHDTSTEAIEGSHVTEMLDPAAAEQFMGHLDAVLNSEARQQIPAVEVTDAKDERPDATRTRTHRLHHLRHQPRHEGSDPRRSVRGVLRDTAQRAAHAGGVQ